MLTQALQYAGPHALLTGMHQGIGHLAGIAQQSRGRATLGGLAQTLEVGIEGCVEPRHGHTQTCDQTRQFAFGQGFRSFIEHRIVERYQRLQRCVGSRPLDDA